LQKTIETPTQKAFTSLLFQLPLCSKDMSDFGYTRQARLIILFLSSHSYKQISIILPDPDCCAFEKKEDVQKQDYQSKDLFGKG
jgi:hypothetical protein